MIYFSKYITLFTFDYKSSTIFEMGLSTILLCGVWLAYSHSCLWIGSEMESGAAYTLFSKPVSRRDYLFGKYGAILLVVFIALFFLSACLWWTLLLLKGWGGEKTILASVGLIALEVAILSSFSVIFAIFFSPVVHLLLLFLIFICGHIQFYLSRIWEGLGFLYILLPDLELYNPLFLRESFLSWKYFIVVACYAIFYIGFILTIGWLIFRRKEFA
ncbi:MAG: hypothetical protein D6805_08875 [Planctomycetota bacterium]|nr:MAG: hypothetical protein D6805_08875 [Planctomycetota bacterium]